MSVETRRLFGRRKILIDDTEITAKNVVEVLQKTLQVHYLNSDEINYLYNYRKGDQPILYREKDIRPEINNKVVENHADEITSFKVAYLLHNHVQYVASEKDSAKSADIIKLNRWENSEKKTTNDISVMNWAHVGGVGIRMVLPDSMANVEADEAPFEQYSLDPRYAYVVYSNSLGEPPVMGVKYVTRSDGVVVYSVYTADRYYEIGYSPDTGHQIIRNEVNPLGMVPMVEYPLTDRMGCFEKVLPLLDALDLTASDRENGLEQFVQALLLFHNVDISSEDFEKLRDLGGLKYTDLDDQHKGDVKYLIAELKQTETQVLVDWEYQVILNICGMPNRNGTSHSTSDTGAATIVRDGWFDAEAKAKDTESLFRDSEMEYLKIVLKICNVMGGLNLTVGDIEVKMPRRVYENLQAKAQVLTTLLSNPKVAPRRAYIVSDLFPDPEEACEEGMKYYEESMEQNRLTAAPGAASGEDTKQQGQDGNGDNGKEDQTDTGSGGKD